MKRIVITEIQYKRLLRKTLIESETKLDVLFVGDSQTKNPDSYANKLIKSGIVTGKVIAENGLNTKKMLSKLISELKNNKYDIISIMGGGNDGGSKTPDGAISNLTDMYEIVKNSGAEIIAISNPTKIYVGQSDNKSYKNKKYPSNDEIAEWVNNQSVSDFKINANKLTKHPHYFLSDMVHLNSEAHDYIKNLWLDTVDITKDISGNKIKDISGNKIKDINVSIGGEESENLEKGLEMFDTDTINAEEFLNNIESLLDQGEDILIERQTEGSYSYNDSVEDLQIALILLGHQLPIYGIDGLFGPETESTVMSYQHSNGLNDDGIIDYDTVESIVENLSEYSDEEINYFLSGDIAQELNKSYDFVSDREIVSPSKLLEDLDSELNNTNLSMALVANASGESSMNVDSRGDGGQYASKSERSIGGYCSFGLWQYNICGGLGVELLKYYGVDVDSDTNGKKMEILGDYDKQVSFMVNHIKGKGVINQDRTVNDWIDWIVRKIERPSDIDNAIVKRIGIATKLGYTS